MKRILLSILVTSCYLLSVDSLSHQTKNQVSGSREYFYTLSSTIDGYYSAVSAEYPESTKWEVTQTIPSRNYSKKCLVLYDADKDKVSKKVLKAWSHEKAVLADLSNGVLQIYQLNMSTCVSKEYIIRNVDAFQVYATNDEEFDVLYTSTDDKLKDYIMRNTYSDTALKMENQNVVRRPDPKQGGHKWEVLLLANTSYHSEARLKNGKPQQVIAQIEPDLYNTTELMESSDDGIQFLISNRHGQLGACYVVIGRYLICKRFAESTTPTFTFTLDQNDLKRAMDQDSRTNLFLSNLDKGSSLILFVDEYDNTTGNYRTVRSFLPLVVHPDGHYVNASTKEVFEKPLACSKRDLNVVKQISPDVNVIEREDEFCFQFLCTHYSTADSGYLPLRYKISCLKKERFGLITKEKPKPNGVEAAFNPSTLIVSWIALVVANFMN